MFLKKPQPTTLEQQQTKAQILELIHFERFCRDNALWDEMRKCFSKDSFVEISWYQGTGDGFVTASSEMKLYAPHKIYNALTWLNGNRAVTVMMVTIEAQMEQDGVPFCLAGDAKLLFGTERQANGDWLISRFQSIYDKDAIFQVVPNSHLPISPSDIAPYRKSYACLSYCLERSGFPVSQELAGRDRPDLVEKLYAQFETWLYEKN